MKKIYYFLALTAAAFASCNPLNNTYKDIDAHPAAQTITISTATSYATLDLAKAGIVALLNQKYANLPDNSSATVSFPLATTFTLSPDNLSSHVAVTLAASDYTFPGNTAAYLTDATAISYLNYKYPTPVANQLAVLTYNYFLSTATPAAGTLTTDSFIFFNNAWTKIYTVSPAQYASVGRGTNNYFISADAANIPAYLSAFLSNDAVVMATAKTGDVKYISFKNSATTQNVFALTYNGSAWVNLLAANFLKLNGTWIPDPTVYIVEATGTNPDYAYLNTLNIGSTSARANVASFGDFDIRTNGAATTWNDTDVTNSLAAILLHKFPSPTIGIPYKVTYYVYTGSVSAASKTFVFNGTAFIQQT